MNKASFSEAEAFLAVVDRGGFGAAARELGITQSTVSRRIAALETRIGKRLIERTTRRVALTEAGLAFANDLRDVLARLSDAEGRVQSEGSEPEGLLRVTMGVIFLFYGVGKFRGGLTNFVGGMNQHFAGKLPAAMVRTLPRRAARRRRSSSLYWETTIPLSQSMSTPS